MLSSIAVCRQKNVSPRMARANGHPRFTGPSVRRAGNRDNEAAPTRKRSARIASQRPKAGVSNIAKVNGIQTAEGIRMSKYMHVKIPKPNRPATSVFFGSTQKRMNPVKKKKPTAARTMEIVYSG